MGSPNSEYEGNRMKPISGWISVGCLLAGVGVMAQPGEWSVATGVLNRQIDTSFNFPTPNLSVMSLVNQRGDRRRGPLPLYTDALDGTVLQFNEGTLGPDTYSDGDVDATYDMSALTLTDRGYILAGEGGQEGPFFRPMARIHRLNLTTDGGTSYDYSTDGSWSGASAGDTVNATGGFIETRYGLNVLGQGWINLLAGVRMFEADAAAQRSHGLITVRERRTDYTHRYGYDVVQFPRGFEEGPGDDGQLDELPQVALTTELIMPYIPMGPIYDTPEEYAVIDGPEAADSEYYAVHPEEGNPFLAPSRTTDSRSRTRSRRV